MTKMDRSYITYQGHTYSNCRAVARVHVDSPSPHDEVVWHSPEGLFFCAPEGVVNGPGVTHHTTIRKALSHAVRGAGWG